MLPTKDNPSNAPSKSLPERERIPMSLPVARLAVPEIPGFHLHWMRGDPQRIAQALKAGYEWVDQDEVDLNRIALGEGEDSSGHQDLGSRVSIVSWTGEDGGMQNLYLMKIRQDWWDQDQAKLGVRQEQIAAQIRGESGFTETGGDNSNRYSRAEKSQKNLFQPKRST